MPINLPLHMLSILCSRNLEMFDKYMEEYKDDETNWEAKIVYVPSKRLGLRDLDSSLFPRFIQLLEKTLLANPENIFDVCYVFGTTIQMRDKISIVELMPKKIAKIWRKVYSNLLDL
jgi:hypothetical protein